VFPRIPLITSYHDVQFRPSHGPHAPRFLTFRSWGKKMASVSGVKPAGEPQQIVHRIWFWLMLFVPKFPTHLLDFMNCYIYNMFIKFHICLLVFILYIYIYYIYTHILYIIYIYYIWSSKSTFVCCFSYVFIQLSHVVPVWIRGTLAPVHRQAIWPAASEAPPVGGGGWVPSFWRTLGL
jgi:hypothetical protein